MSRSNLLFLLTVILILILAGTTYAQVQKRAPGFSHCGGGAGPSPSGQMEALLAWVEVGKAPETLDATLRERDGTVARSRPLCPYPLVAKYKGSGSTDDADNFDCSEEF